MCGIVGYVGDADAADVIIDGLKRLEYRGYDSAGIAVLQGGKLALRKKKGRISNLEELIAPEKLKSNIGIGHTRWATHGAPSDANAHPHADSSGRFAVVHNGIIENYAELKEELQREHGTVFKSETDSEVMAHLTALYYDEQPGGSLEDAVYRMLERVEGSYAIGVISSEEPGKVVAARKNSPLLVGPGKTGNFIASDIPAIMKHARQVYLIENDDLVVLTKSSVRIYDGSRKPVSREVFNVTWDAEAAEKGGYEHFMLKEIHEQPSGIKDTIVRRLGDSGEIELDGINLTKEDIENIDHIYIVACGTAYHAGLVGKYAIEKLAGIRVEVDIASEFKYRDPIVNERTLFIAISQSGETIDTLGALREAKSKGARVLSVVNVVGSSVARESDDVFYTWAGPEIAVASTKAYTTQLVCMYLIGLYMGRKKGTLKDDIYRRYIDELMQIPDKVSEILEHESEIERIAEKYYMQNDIFFIGRGMDSAVSYEGSLKLKEISYINSFAIAAGELKHGTIALMESGTLVIAIAVQDSLYPKMRSNIEEVEARGAGVFAVAKEGNSDIDGYTENVFKIPRCMDEISPLLSIVPLQLFAYYIAKKRGCDIDKPKNLAKSVTTE